MSKMYVKKKNKVINIYMDVFLYRKSTTKEKGEGLAFIAQYKVSHMGKKATF